jgi:hypothetical protein
MAAMVRVAAVRPLPFSPVDRASCCHSIGLRQIGFFCASVTVDDYSGGKFQEIETVRVKMLKLTESKPKPSRNRNRVATGTTNLQPFPQNRSVPSDLRYRTIRRMTAVQSVLTEFHRYRVQKKVLRVFGHDFGKTRHQLSSRRHFERKGGEKKAPIQRFDAIA